MKISDFVGKRVLLKISRGSYSNEVTEFRVLEVSPSGNWAKLMNLHGNKFWKPIQEISFVEELKQFENHPNP